MGTTVRSLRLRLSREEFIGWIAYYRINPFGEYRADLRAAMIACSNASLWADKKTKITITDFLLFPPEKQKATPQSVAHQKKIARMASMLSGKLRRPRV